MDKKLGVYVFFSLIFLFGMILLTNVVKSGEGNDGDIATDVLGQVNISVYGDGYSNDSSTKGSNFDTSEIVNLTIFYGLTTASTGNITNISITWSGNYTFIGWVSGLGDGFEGACTTEGADFCDPTDLGANTAGGNVTFANVTTMNDNVGSWACYNLTATDLRCYNTTATDALGGDNTTIQIRFNVTADANIEDLNLWNVTVSTDDIDTDATNETTVGTFVDGLAPRLSYINITDGNITLENDSAGGLTSFIINDSWRFGLDNDLSIFATVEDLNVNTTSDENTLFLVFASGNGTYDVTDGNLTTMGGVNINNGSAAFVNTTANVYSPIIVDTWKRTNPTSGGVTLTALLKWTINASDLTDDNITRFEFLVNDSFDQGAVHTETGLEGADGKAFKFEVNDTHLIKFGNVNITDGTNTLGGSSLINTSFLKTGNLTLNVEVSGIGLTNMTIYYNESADFGNNPTDLSRGAIFINANVPLYNQEYTEGASDHRFRNLTVHNTSDGAKEIWEIDLDMHLDNTTQAFTFLVVANASLNGSETEAEEIVYGRSNDYAIYGGPYFVTLDSTDPSATITAPSNRGISTADSIEYTCAGSDAHSGVNGYTWILAKPDGSEIEYTKVSTSAVSNAKTFSGSDISSPGIYTVKCKVHDSVDNTFIKTSTEPFTVNIDSGSGGSGGGSGGSGGGEATVSFDADLSQINQASFKASQGRVKTFSFDGATKHTVTFNEIGDKGVTLIIASTPMTITLKIGEFKAVDLNADGIDDLKVTLNSIVNGVADIVMDKIQIGADKIKAEEEKAREVTSIGEEISSVAAKTSSMVWVVLIIVVVAVGIGYGLKKRK